MKKLIVFGTGVIAEAVSYYFERDSEYEICAYICDREFIKAPTFLDKPVIATEECVEKYDPNTYSIFVAIGYQGMNKVREQKYQHFKSLKYNYASYISPSVVSNIVYGRNCIVMDGAIIQPCVQLADNVFIWGGAMIGHHAKIESHCWITGGADIGGLITMGRNTFVGISASVVNEISIGVNCMLGAGTLTCKSLKAGSVLVEPGTTLHRLKAEQFVKLSNCFRSR